MGSARPIQGIGVKVSIDTYLELGEHVQRLAMDRLDQEATDLYGEQARLGVTKMSWRFAYYEPINEDEADEIDCTVDDPRCTVAILTAEALVDNHV